MRATGEASPAASPWTPELARAALLRAGFLDDPPLRRMVRIGTETASLITYDTIDERPDDVGDLALSLIAHA